MILLLMVELFQHTEEQDGQGYCVVLSLLMRYLTITATQAERTIWVKKKKKKKPCWMKGLTTAYVCCSANIGYVGRCERQFLIFASRGAVVVVHQRQDQKCGLLAETQGRCWCDWVFCLSLCGTNTSIFQWLLQLMQKIYTANKGEKHLKCVL